MNTNYEGNENMIVRVKNEAVMEYLDLVAYSLDLPVQWVFNAYLDAIVLGYSFGSQPFDEYILDNVKKLHTRPDLRK